MVFDLETTGISKQWDEIIEISAIKVKDHRIIEEFSTLVNPGRPIPAGATAVNGITDEMVLNAPGRMEAISDFLSFVGDQVLVGHNIHSFDLGFVERAARENLGRELFNDYVDTLPLARWSNGQEDSEPFMGARGSRRAGLRRRREKRSP